MKKISQFVLLYVISIVIILGVYNTSVSTYKEDIKVVNTQLDGLEYLKRISVLTELVIKYMSGATYAITKNELIEIHSDINSCVKYIHEHQEKSKIFINKDLNAQLSLIKYFEMSESAYYDFLSSINHENYIIGDKSKLLFEEDRELFFLGSLVTHYMPEYLISTLLSHTIIEELNYQNHLSDKKKNIFIEQTKLSYLSAQEISEIIDLIQGYGDVGLLKKNILDINNELKNIKNILLSLYRWENNKKSIDRYLISSHKLLDFSHSFNNELQKLIEINLKNKKDTLLVSILDTRLIFFLIISIFSFLMYLFYKSTILHIKKDKEIEGINKTLDALVVFSKTDIDGTITYVSSALESISGYSKDELIGENHRILKHEKMAPVVFEDMWKTILEKKVYIGDILNKAKDGSSYWVKLTITPELNSSGEIIAFSAHRLNITDQKALEEKKMSFL